MSDLYEPTIFNKTIKGFLYTRPDACRSMSGVTAYYHVSAFVAIRAFPISIPQA
jgi:hypothetical protein